MDLNNLYILARSGGQKEEQNLFQEISARFLLIAQYRIGDLHTAEDIVQDTIIDIMKKYKGLDLSDRFAAWSQKILKLNILNYLRNTGRHQRILRQLSSSEKAVSESGTESGLQRKVRDCLRKVANVNLRYARILNLIYLGFEVQEICSKMNISRNNAYSILFRARSMLRLCLDTGEIE
jgi:RNA polymerase sigma factor (sigma-70 family)